MVVELSSGPVQHLEDGQRNRVMEAQPGRNWEETNRQRHPGSHKEEARASLVVKNLLAGARDTSSIPGLGRSHMPGSN